MASTPHYIADDNCWVALWAKFKQAIILLHSKG
jgi:hypothetical protein